MKFYVKNDAYDQIPFSSHFGFAHQKSRHSFAMSEIGFIQCSLDNNFSKQMMLADLFACSYFQFFLIFKVMVLLWLNNDQRSVNHPAECMLNSHLSSDYFLF